MKVPYTNFKTRTGDTDEVGGCTFIGGEWKEVDTTEIFDNKKIVAREQKTTIEQTAKYFAFCGIPRPSR